MNTIAKLVDAVESGLAACENNIGTLILVTLPFGLIGLAILFWFMVHPF